MVKVFIKSLRLYDGKQKTWIDFFKEQDFLSIRIYTKSLYFDVSMKIYGFCFFLKYFYIIIKKNKGISYQLIKNQKLSF